MHCASLRYSCTALHCIALQYSTEEVRVCVKAGDDKFKAELGWVVNLDMWDAARQLAAHKLKGFSSQLVSVASQEQLRLTDLTRLDSQVGFAYRRLSCNPQKRKGLEGGGERGCKLST